MKNIITICLIILLVSICLIFTGCNSKNDSKEFVQKTFELGVNQSVYSMGESFSSPYVYLVYNGMNTEKTFSVSGRFYSSVNTYYSAILKEFNWYGCQFRIDTVNSEKLVITLIGYNPNLK